MDASLPTKEEIEQAKNALLEKRDGNISDTTNRKEVERTPENEKHARVLQYLIEHPDYENSFGGSRRRRRPSRKYKKSSKRVFRKKSRSTRRR
jgi:hypothetical protein